MTKQQLAVQEQQLSIQQPLSMGAMLSAFIDKGVTEANVAAFGQLIALQERIQDREAQKEFAAALAELQGETIRVVATKAVDVKNGVPRYTFAPYEEIMKTVQPMLTAHGFSITFDTKIDDNRVFSICTLTHKSGCSRTNQFAVRLGNKPPGSSDAQGDMSNKSYAKRGALCDALNIVIDHDDDARLQGSAISQQDADNLRERVKATGSDEAKFLAWAGAETYEEISESRFDQLDDFLRRKEMKNPKPLESQPLKREPGETGQDLF